MARRELILGGQRSGKSHRAELLARHWLLASAGHNALLLATAEARDAEMGERIARHQADRAGRVPGMGTVEEPQALAEALHRHGAADTLIVVDCLTLWLTKLMMPVDPAQAQDAKALEAATGELFKAITVAPGPIVLVSNEIGLGVIPIGRDLRHFVDELGRLNQAVAALCERVTLMVAGCPMAIKGGSA